MISGVQDIYFNVMDMERAVTFYTTVLGMKLKHTDQWWSSLDCGGVNIGLHWNENQPVSEVPRDAHGALAGATLTLKSDDIAADRKKLEQYGAKILGEADQLWGHMLVFVDPDNNVLKLMRPK